MSVVVRALTGCCLSHPHRRALLRSALLPWLMTGLLCVCAPGASGCLAADDAATSQEKSAKDQDAGAPEEKTEEPEQLENPFPRRIKAPDLDGGNGWLNTSGEITMKDLRGKVVMLDFWTYCCINCMHVLPDLKALERKYGNQLVVIGVHSAKFDNEKESDNIRQAIMRYEIEHPVINDSEMTVWRKFGVNAWPSFVLVDPEGYAFLAFSSEIGDRREALEAIIDKVIAYHRAKGTLDEGPVRFDLERGKVEPTPLRYPGKILADEKGGRLFISDSNHNRIVVASLDGKLREVIGSGAIGRSDGSFAEASFNHPQGMALVGETLYVADTENHLLRAIDLNQKKVTTTAGTGVQGYERRGGPDALKVGINSPWDLAHVEGKLYICMAGPHQIWALNLKDKSLEVYAGSGREDILNGPLAESALAQPSGISTDGEFLYVVDSEGSALRKIPLDPEKEVTTIVGTSDLRNGRSLFEFGDKDGKGGEARLQHPLGLVYHNGTIFVADSYNHKLKKVDPKAQTVTTYLGDGEPGDRESPPRFSEPAGLAVAKGTLYVADTNNHRVRTVDLKTGTVSTLAIAGLSPPQPPKSSSPGDTEMAKSIEVATQRVMAGDSLEFEVPLALPEGYKLNRQAPLTFRLKADDNQPLISAEQLGSRQEITPPDEGATVTFRVPLAARTGEGKLQVSLNYGYCRDGKGGLCKLGTLNWTVPVEVASDGEVQVIRLPVEE